MCDVSELQRNNIYLQSILQVWDKMSLNQSPVSGLLWLWFLGLWDTANCRCHICTLGTDRWRATPTERNRRPRELVHCVVGLSGKLNISDLLVL